MSLIADLTAAFKGQLVRIEMPEGAEAWGWPEIVYAQPFTLSDRDRFEELFAKSQSQTYLRIVVEKVCNAEGEREFEDKDRFALQKRTPAWALTHIGDQIVQSQSSFEDEEKNE